MLVRDVMTHDPVTARTGTSIKAALMLLDEHRITSLPVLDGRGRLRGVISEADLVRDLVPLDSRAHEIPVNADWHDRPSVVADVMTPHAVVVRPDTELADAVDLMTSTSVKSLPVVDSDVVVGMISRSDIVHVLARADQQLAGDVDALLGSLGIEDWLVEVSDGTVTLTGPEGSRFGMLARLAAGTVPGVLEVVEAAGA